jgi:amino acid transporter
MVLSFAYAFGLMSSAMPSPGGDYIVSRTLHPAVGMISSLFTNFANMLERLLSASPSRPSPQSRIDHHS